tara:strand:+ start:315 stop:521 length:207 start_codon:yes stop_codon:yes gene_type:complete
MGRDYSKLLVLAADKYKCSRSLLKKEREVFCWSNRSWKTEQVERNKEDMRIERSNEDGKEWERNKQGG